MKPLIALSVAVDNEATTSAFYTYTKAIELGGGVPLIIPYTESEETKKRLVELCDGFCFTGGVDIHPYYYAEQVKEACGTITDIRDTFELSLFRAALKTQKPIMGICRGAQLINVALGGTLYQDIPTEYETEIAHRQVEEKMEYSHSVTVLENTPLSALVGEGEMRANSFHHQAAKRLGNGLLPMAYAADGIVEAMYFPAHTYLRAYQWHPERLCERDEKNKALFTEFITACVTKI